MSGSPHLVAVVEADWGRTYTPEDLEAFMLEPPEPPRARERSATPYIGPARPGDAFNAAVDPAEMLERAGWQHHHTDARTGDRHYTRPGKERRDGSSATVYAEDRHVCVWTDATSLEPRRWYDAFGLYTALFHGGDHRSASDELERQGYGTKPHRDLSWLLAPGDAPTAQQEGQMPQEAPVEPWPEPIPLADAAELPPFPIDALPEWIADHATSVADELQVPVDLPATLALAALSTIAARRTEVLVRSTWREQVNLYLVVAMPPGSGKSPAFRAMLGPLEAYEAEQVTKGARAAAEAEQKHRMLEKAVKRAEEKGDAGEAARLLAELNEHEVPKPLRLIADDATPEALVALLAEQKGRLALLSTEGGVFDLMTGRYSDRSNLDPYLQAWAGDTIRIDRIGRGAHIIRRPALTIGLTVQPTVIASLAERPELAGRGLTARFMYAIPEDIVGRRNLIDAPAANPAARSTYDRTLVDLAETLGRYLEPGTLTLDHHALDLFLRWRQDLEVRREPSGDLRPLAEWTTKLESSTARLAGLLHLAKGGRPHAEIDASTMLDALAVADYWLAHARAVHDLWGTNPTLNLARRVLDWLRGRGSDEGSFSVRDLYAANRRSFDRAEDTVDPLELLVERGWIRPLFDGELRVGRRGKESPRFAPNPAIWCAQRAHDGSHARHARHARKDKKETSLSLPEKTNVDKPPSAHDAHGAQLPDDLMDLLG